MNKPIGIVLLAGVAAALLAGNVFAGRGGGARGGGGFQGGGNRSYGGANRSYSGGDRSYGGANRSYGGANRSYGGANRSYGGGDRSYGGNEFRGDRNENNRGSAFMNGGAGHTPSFNTPRTDNRSYSDLSRAYRPEDRPSMTINPWVGGAGSRAPTHAWNGARPGTLPARTDWGRNDWAHHDWYHGNWNNHWDHPWNRWPNGWFGAGAAWGLAAATPWSWGYYSYDNPYYVAPIVAGDTTIDYSQPIAAGGPDVAPAGQLADQAPQADQSSQFLDAARNAFAQGDYSTALRQVDQAIAAQPGDPVAHEFRSLICFALKRYKEAAAGAYAVLSAGPGWDWTTLSGFYSDVNVYTEQLRALEQYVDSHPNEADVRFLLAYQYLTCGYNDAATRQLKAVVELNPKDRLSSQLLASLSPPATPAAPEPAAPAAPPKPVNAASLVGNWNAQQPDGTSVGLKMTADSKYTWEFTRQGKTQAHSGTYTVADNLLILKQGNTPAMVGQVATVGDDQFNFKLANDNPGDPGLTFSK